MAIFIEFPKNLDDLSEALEKIDKLNRENDRLLIDIEMAESKLRSEQLFNETAKLQVADLARTQQELDSLTKEVSSLKEKLEVSEEKAKKFDEIGGNPQINKIIEELSLIILSKDPTNIEPKTKNFIKEIFGNNSQELIKSIQEKFETGNQKAEKLLGDINAIKLKALGYLNSLRQVVKFVLSEKTQGGWESSPGFSEEVKELRDLLQDIEKEEKSLDKMGTADHFQPEQFGAEPRMIPSVFSPQLN